MSENSQIPDVGDIIEYGLDSFGKSPAKYRVNSWLRRRVYTASAYDAAISGAMPNEYCSDIGGIQEWEICELVGINKKWGDIGKELIHCIKPLAEYVSASGICGCVAPINKIKIVGRVDWPEEMIEDYKKKALWFARMDSQKF